VHGKNDSLCKAYSPMMNPVFAIPEGKSYDGTSFVGAENEGNKHGQARRKMEGFHLRAFTI